jgi:hypothetical protein
MKLIWRVELHEIERVRAFYQTHEDDPFVQERRRRNLADNKPLLAKAEIWRALVACLLSTQQRSGPFSATSRFISEQPFPLGYEHCLAQADLKAYAREALRDYGGIRRYETIASQLSNNLALLEEGLWSETIGRMDSLRSAESTPQQERAVAAFIYDRFSGFGPKQSRNLLQQLGLTRYEVPIDSRIVKWLNQFDFPLQLSAAALSDPGYFNLVSDGFQQLCLQSGLYPCLLDAAIFTSFDNGKWTEDNVIW